MRKTDFKRIEKLILQECEERLCELHRNVTTAVIGEARRLAATRPVSIALSPNYVAIYVHGKTVGDDEKPDCDIYSADNDDTDGLIELLETLQQIDVYDLEEDEDDAEALS
ncbi:MAG: hypothetical protein E7590_00040 [Ruminococcaceae bacterium]|nr:hypothetical protein [Oscillospiraceae bacterium]